VSRKVKRAADYWIVRRPCSGIGCVTALAINRRYYNYYYYCSC